MSLNLTYSGIQNIATNLVVLPPPATWVRQEAADSNLTFFSDQFVILKDLAIFILDRVPDTGLARMRAVNRKWYWVIDNCPRLQSRLIVGSCIRDAKAATQDIQPGWFSSDFHILTTSGRLAEATLAIAEVDPNFLGTAKVAAFSIGEDGRRTIAVLKFVRVEAKWDCNRAKATALTIENLLLRADAEKEIEKVETEQTSPAEVTVLIGRFAKRYRDSLAKVNIKAQTDLKGAKEMVLKFENRILKTMAFLEIAKIDPSRDYFTDAKLFALKDAKQGLYAFVNSKIGIRTSDDYETDILLLEIVYMEAFFNSTAAKQTALMIKEPYYRAIALTLVAKAALNRLSPSSN